MDDDDTSSRGRASLPRSVRRGESPESTLTPSSMRSHRRNKEDIARVNSFLLTDLADNLLSPVKRMDPLFEEEAYDKQAYDDNPGASDSEDEDEVERDLGAAFTEAANDREEFDSENNAALCNAADLMETYNEELARFNGQLAYHVCMLCTGPDGKKGVAVHPFVKKGVEGDGECPCFIHHHNTAFFGLSKNDHKLSGTKRKKDWAPPTNEDIMDHAKEIRRVLENTPEPPGVSATTPMPLLANEQSCIL